MLTVTISSLKLQPCPSNPPGGARFPRLASQRPSDIVELKLLWEGVGGLVLRWDLYSRHTDET
jgi:hypothetical protein